MKTKLVNNQVLIITIETYDECDALRTFSKDPRPVSIVLHNGDYNDHRLQLHVSHIEEKTAKE